MNKVNDKENVSEKMFVIEQELRDIYYNPETGYQSAERQWIKS